MSDDLRPLIGTSADRPLTRAEAETAFGILFAGEATPAQIGGLLMALRTRGETVEEYAAAPAHMSFMLGTRFLTDHFDGDRYFGVTRRGENLERARAQFELTRQFDRSIERLCEILAHAMR